MIVFKTLISDATPELNFIVKNKSHKKRKITFLSDQNYTKYECDLEFGETPIGEGASIVNSSASITNDHVLELSRYMVEMDADSMMASYITFDYKNGATRLPCDIKYSLFDEGGNIISKNIYRVERPVNINQEIGAKLRDFKISTSVQSVKERENMTAVVLLENLSDKSANIMVKEKELMDCNAIISDEKIRSGMQRGGEIEIKGYLPIYTSLTLKKLEIGKKCKLKLRLINKDDVDDELEINIPIVKNVVYKDHRHKDPRGNGHSMF
ncbi:hypothetical protein [Janthinobacterium sp.]|uniref:hypothetical protein n=1 Tax=Janthinobacterium sp. TaxID=1871054 RepID=UPI0026226704|nr:hypothetical protein [Janthinobacterium sp.]